MMNIYMPNEDGFSLVELAVASAIAIVISGAALLALPNLKANTQSKADAYSECLTKHETLANQMMNGNEPTNNTACATAQVTN